MNQTGGDDNVVVEYRIPYFQAGTYVIRDASLTAQARLLYALLCSYANSAGESWPSIATLTELLGCSARTMRRARDELVSAGYLAITTRLHVNGRQRSNLYVLKDHVIHKGGSRATPLEGGARATLPGGARARGRVAPVPPLQGVAPVPPLEEPDELEGCTHGFEHPRKCALCRVENRKAGTR